MFTFQYELGQREQVRACRVMYHRRRDAKLTYAFLLTCLMVAFGFHFYLRAHGREPWGPGLVIVVAGVLAGLTVAYTSPYWLVRNLRKNNRSAAGPHVFTMSEDGLATKSPGMAGSIEWANICEAYETREFLFFYVSKGMATVVPTRVISTAELPALRSAMHEWLGERAHTLPTSSAHRTRSGTSNGT